MTASRPRPIEPTERYAAPSVVARVVALPPGGPPEVAVDGLGVRRARVLRSVDRAWLRGEHAIGREVLVVFARGADGAEEPVILGVLEDPADALLAVTTADVPPQVDVTVDGRSVVLEASHEITLRCGEASLTLHADGRVTTRGVNIVSQASEQQRIQGAVVKIN